MAESLAKVRAAFDAWRAKRPGKVRGYPQSLKERALALPWTGDDAELSAALGLSHVTVLRNWRRARAMRQGTGEKLEVKALEPFVDVGTVGELERAFQVDEENPVLEVALESVDGRRLRIRGALERATVLDLARVAFEAGGGPPCSR